MGDADHTDDYRPTPLEWMQTIRRAEIHPERKAACLIIATYAHVIDDPGSGRRLGEGICPGVDRLALDLRRSVVTARRHLEWMRDVGLIVLVRRGNRRRRQSDEYRLAMSEDALQRAKIPDPDEYKELIGCGKQADRIRHKRRRDARKQDPEADAITAQQVSGKEPITAQSGTGLPLILDERPQIHVDTNHDHLTEHEVVDLRTNLTVTRAQGPNEEGFTTQMHVEPPDGDRHQCPTGLGWCIICYAELGQAVLAADSVSGSHCRIHTRTITAQARSHPETAAVA